jgi:hypothetical protein
MFGKSVFDKATESDIATGHVAICVPTNGMVHANFAYCLVDAIRYTESEGISVSLVMHEGTVLSNQRQQIAAEAILEHRADHLMWLDSDMTFPADTILRLLARRKDVVCAAYSKRVEPFIPTAFTDIDPVVPVAISGKLRRVKYAGMGCMLVNADVMHRLTTPWFPLIWHEPSQSWHGEDMGFCDLLDSQGIPIWCDIPLSLDLGHIGSKEFILNQED